MNFVKTKLFLDKLQAGDILEVCLDDGEPVTSVYESIRAEGHVVTTPCAKRDGSFGLTITKA